MFTVRIYESAVGVLQSIDIPGYKRILILDNYDYDGCLMEQISIHDDDYDLVDDDKANEYMVLYL